MRIASKIKPVNNASFKIADAEDIAIGSTDVKSKINQVDNTLHIITNNTISIEMFPKIAAELDDRYRFQRAIEALVKVGGGTIMLPKGEYIVNSIHVKDNIRIVGCGDKTIIKHVNNAHDFNNIFEMNDCSNWMIKNLVIDGNRENQSGSYKHGIYTLNTTNGIVDNVIVKNVYGEGFMLGYTGYLSKKIVIKNSRVENCARNEIALSNVDGVLLDNITVKGIDSFSATIDIEKHANGDIHNNIEFRNCNITCGTTPIKLITNGYIGSTKNILFNKINVNGQMNIDNFNNVKFINSCNINSINILASYNIDLGDTYISNKNGYGLYITKKGDIKSTNITMDNITITNCHGQGIVIMDSENICIKNPNITNNNGVGISVQYATKFVNIMNGKITDTRQDKTQTYAIEFIGSTHANIIIDNVYLKGNKIDEFKDRNDAKTIVNGFFDYMQFANTKNLYSLNITFDDNANFNIPTTFYANMLGILKQSSSKGWIQNGMIFEDTDGKLKYKNRAGVINELTK